MASDFAMFRRLGRQVKPGGYDMQWLVEDFETAIRSELDCENEARNCEIASRLLAGRGGAKCPKVVWELTRTDVLVMEYVPGLIRLTEPEVLTANGLDLVECGQQVSDALMELALVHGHVHGDPHAGNIYVVGERAGRLQRRIRPCVVVLDHGLYHHIDDTLRRDVCSLFLACIGRHRRDITRLSHKCAGPLGRFFPLLLSPWFVLGTSLSSEDVRAARNNKLPPSVSAKDVGDAMTSLHVMGGNMLGVLHSFGYVRGLLNAVSFGERRRLKSVARLSVIGLLPPPIAHQVLRRGDSALPLAWRWKLWNARANVDITAALLYVLSTATTEEFDVAKTPAVVVHLAAALLAVGRWSSMKALNEAMVAVYFFFCPDDYVAETREGAGGVEVEGQETAVGSSTEASQRHTRQQAESQAELAGASPGGEGASGSECEEGRVGAVSLLQKVKGLGGGVLQRAGSLTSSVTSSMASRYRDRVGAASVCSDTSSMVVGDNPERVRNGGRASSFDEAGGGSAPSLMGSVISRADSEAWYQGGGLLRILRGSSRLCWMQREVRRRRRGIQFVACFHRWGLLKICLVLTSDLPQSLWLRELGRGRGGMVKGKEERERPPWWRDSGGWGRWCGRWRRRRLSGCGRCSVCLCPVAPAVAMPEAKSVSVAVSIPECVLCCSAYSVDT